MPIFTPAQPRLRYRAHLPRASSARLHHAIQGHKDYGKGEGLEMRAATGCCWKTGITNYLQNAPVTGKL